MISNRLPFLGDMSIMTPHRMPVEDLEKELHTHLEYGISSAQAAARLERFGPNSLPAGKQFSWVMLFFYQFTSPLIYILVFAAMLIFIFGDNKLDAFIITGILLFNAIIGTVQEGRTHSILESLNQFIKTSCVVVRDGKHVVIDNADLVIGDVIVLQAGQRVPADARVAQADNLYVDEAVLTGESLPVQKKVAIVSRDIALLQANNMVFNGTLIQSGSGRAVVIATGMQTQIGKINKQVQAIKTEIPLRKDLDRLSYIILLFIAVFCAVLFGLGIFLGHTIDQLFVMLVALFICVVPEGLPVVLTLVLVTGVYRMAKKQVLVKNMQAVEALGRTNVIVVDKTGTLTRNEMVVSHVWADGKLYDVSGVGYFKEGCVYENGQPIKDTSALSSLDHIAHAAWLLNTAEIEFIPAQNMFEIYGDPTEAALYIFACKAGKQDAMYRSYIKKYEIPFDSRWQYHAMFYEYKNNVVMYIIGAPERISTFTSDVSKECQEYLHTALDQGLRVVAVGMKEFAIMPEPNLGDEVKKFEYYKKMAESDVRLLGLCAMQDSIRPEVADLIRQTRKAGLQIVMATGDHQKTAMHVAQEVAIYQPGDITLDGTQLEEYSDAALQEILPKVTVFSRVSPTDKMRIITLLHANKKIVAMTGDGINDAPSLVAADVGIAMGSIGTEIAKQAADIVLLNDSFVNIVQAIEQGRHILYTLRRVVLYFFSTNMGEILIVLFAMLVNLPLPITAAQILWLNLITDGFLDVALSMEDMEPDLLQARWLTKRKKLVDNYLLFKMMFMAIPMGIGSLWIFWQYYQIDIVKARTMTMLTMALYQWFNAWNCRSDRRSLFSLGLSTNGWLVVATLFVAGLQCLQLYAPFMNYLFDTVPVNGKDWLLAISITAPILLVEEVRKYIMRRIDKKAN